MAAETLSPVIEPETERRITALLQRACDADLRLSTAESCTGGLLASLMTDIPGCSHVFEAGIVSYSETAKTRLLGVPSKTLREDGAVSRETALAMVDGVLAQTNADIAISITGFAGAAGKDDEAGLVYLGGGLRDGARLVREYHFGPVGRGATRIATIEASLDMLEALLDHRDA